MTSKNVSFVVFRQIYLFVTKQMNLGFVAVALAYPMGWILCSVLLTIRYRRSRLFEKTPEQGPEAAEKQGQQRVEAQ